MLRIDLFVSVIYQGHKQTAAGYSFKDLVCVVFVNTLGCGNLCYVSVTVDTDSGMDDMHDMTTKILRIN